MKRDGIRKMAAGGMTAALYIVLTFISHAMGLASGAVQVRLSETLCLLPCLTPAAVPGLGVGCLLANLMTGCAGPDILFGTAATVIGAAGTRMLRERPRIAWIPPVMSNTLIIPFVLRAAYGVKTGWGLLALAVFAGEMIGCCVLGMCLLPFEKRALDRMR